MREHAIHLLGFATGKPEMELTLKIILPAFQRAAVAPLHCVQQWILLELFRYYFTTTLRMHALPSTVRII
jgi:hypothetical protein